MRNEKDEKSEKNILLMLHNPQDSSLTFFSHWVSMMRKVNYFIII